VLVDRERFEARLAREADEVRASDEHLSLALVAVDFPRTPEYRDLSARAAALRLVGSSLTTNVRSDDVLGWVGGGLFAWILRGTDEFADFEAVERVRQVLLRQLSAEPMSYTTSVCGLEASEGPEHLLWRACLGLRWADITGAGLTFRWSADAVQALSELASPTES
jgi:PleD family two-component response regulator